MREAFVLSRSTVIQADDVRPAIQNARDILLRDIALCGLQSGEDNVIRLERDPDLEPEAYHIAVGETEMHIVYADDLGAVYALLFISETFLGIAPFDYWNDRQPPQAEAVAIPAGDYASPARAVRYRGWFINDEVLLDGWKPEPDEKLDMWKRTFETLLRCGGNMVIPGTDRKDDGALLADTALAMGLWLTHHHAELLGAEMFSRAYPDMEPSYSKHPELFERLWEDAVRRRAGQKVIWGVGFRGQGDYAFWAQETGFDTAKARGAMIVRVIRRQMELVRKHDPGAVFCTNLYGEMMALYRQGCLPLPPEIIKVWADNGYGKMVCRRNGNRNERVPSMPVNETGRNGIYYHASFYDLQAANHITMSQNAPAMIRRELEEVLQCGAAEYWLVNTGSVKPHVYILDLIRAIWTDGPMNAAEHAREYARRYFGNEKAGGLFLDFHKQIPQYGPNEDDHAGDQLYHFVLRRLLYAVMRKETDTGIPQLAWLTGDVPFARQITKIGNLCAGSVTGWEPYLRRCKTVQKELDSNAAVLLSDTVLLQAVIHQTGCRALSDACRGIQALLAEKPVEAFLLAGRAILAHRQAVEAMERAEHGNFYGYYRNECFSNIRLSLRMLQAYQSWLRACYDGPHYFGWERQYLYKPEDRNVMCLTHRTNQLDDETMFERLLPILPLPDADDPFGEG